VPKPHPREFRDDVVAVARKGDAPISQIAKDCGISESCLRNWLTYQINRPQNSKHVQVRATTAS